MQFSDPNFFTVNCKVSRVACPLDNIRVSHETRRSRTAPTKRNVSDGSSLYGRVYSRPAIAARTFEQVPNLDDRPPANDGKHQKDIDLIETVFLAHRVAQL
jgi:hypothetical protein